MGSFPIEFTSMSGLYVYYDSLKDTSPNIYNRAIRKYNSVKVSNKLTPQDGSKILAMAYNERQKEEALLRRKQINNPRWGSDSRGTAEFIKDINVLLRTKEVFERQLKFLLYDNPNADGGKRPTYSYISYMETALVNVVEKHLGNKNLNLIQIENLLSNSSIYLEIIKETLRLMSIAGIEAQGMETVKVNVFTEEEQTDLKQGYKILDGLINSLNSPAAKEFVSSSLSKMGAFVDSLKSANNKKNSISLKEFKKSVNSFNFNHQFYADIAEIVTAAIAQKQFSDFTVKSIGRKYKQRADVVLVSLNSDPAEDLFKSIENTKAQSRIEAQKIYKDFYTDKLSKLDNEFIIYVSTKNYLKGTIKDKGFAAGSSISLENFQTLMEGIILNKKKIEEIIWGILQLSKGAIKGGDEHTDLSQALAQYIAYMLFDDVDTIGTNHQTGGNAIHILDLNGIQVPLSVFLYELAKAIDSALEAPTSLVKVNFRVPDIDYPDDEQLNKAREKTSMDKLIEQQRNNSLSTGTISYHFFQGFLGILKDLFI